MVQLREKSSGLYFLCNLLRIHSYQEIVKGIGFGCKWMGRSIMSESGRICGATAHLLDNAFFSTSQQQEAQQMEESQCRIADSRTSSSWLMVVLLFWWATHRILFWSVICRKFLSNPYLSMIVRHRLPNNRAIEVNLFKAYGMSDNIFSETQTTARSFFVQTKTQSEIESMSIDDSLQVSSNITSGCALFFAFDQVR